MRLSTFVLRGVQRAAPGIPTWSAEYDEPCGVQRTCFWISGLLSGMLMCRFICTGVWILS